jgi:hypothetical protein
VLLPLPDEVVTRVAVDPWQAIVLLVGRRLLDS